MTYDYYCIVCEKSLEIEQSIKDDPIKTCPHCLVSCLKRQISCGNFILKGSGWAKDLYSSNGNVKK